MVHAWPFARTLARAFMCAVGALLCSTVSAQVAYTWPVFTVAPNAPTVAALTYLTRQATADRRAPILLQTGSPVAKQEFCIQLRKLAAGIYVAPLSIYRTCFPDTTQLAVLDLPFLARDWTEVRGLLNGSLGAAIAEGLQSHQAEVLSFWDGDDRVISSRTPIARYSDLNGKKVVAPATFASNTIIGVAGGASMQLAAAEVFSALSAGAADTADVSLPFYTQALGDVHRSALLSNHSFDPHVLTVPAKHWEALAAADKGFLESLVARATNVQTQAAASIREQLLSSAAQAGLLVQPMSEAMRQDFRPAMLVNRSQQRAMEVLASSPDETRRVVSLQLRGQRQSAYVSVRFATNRKVAGQSFSSDAAADLGFGQADVELDIQQGGVRPIESRQPWIRYGARGGGVQVAWHGVSTSPPPADVINIPRQSPAKAPLLYVHGFANTFDDALTRGAWISWNTKRPVIVFAWPSRGSAMPADYRADQHMASQSAVALADLLRLLGGSNQGSVTDVDVVAHSMGAYLALAALDVLHGHPGNPALRFRQLVLVAPDVSSSRLEARWADLRRYFDRAATLYMSNHDLALGISRAVMNPADGPRAGLAPPMLVVPQIDSMFIGPNDLSLKGHSYHVISGPIVDDLIETLRYGVPAAERRGVVESLSGKYFELLRLRDP